jgi:hypothetical protein
VSDLEKAIQIQGTSQLKDIQEVLAVHDITYFSYGDFPCEGLGYLTREDSQGIIGINTIAVSTQRAGPWPCCVSTFGHDPWKTMAKGRSAKKSSLNKRKVINGTRALKKPINASVQRWKKFISVIVKEMIMNCSFLFMSLIPNC